ncbi:hypothetical protein N665_0059s0007 [Sinapis alba]|nr:hypothetical protein N665_0059s0007 [Sinapis alba]
MASAPVLTLLDFQEKFVIETDASGYGLGAVLMQKQKLIAYFSKGLLDKERLKPIYEKELMAIVLTIQKWKHYLMGRKFIVYTDQRSLNFLLKQQDISLDYQKWLTKLLGYDFEIVYKAGVDNKVADSLSRILWSKEQDNTEWLGAITVNTTLQMQDIFDEVDKDKALQKRVYEMTVGNDHKPGYTMVGGRMFYMRRLVLSRESSHIPLILKLYHYGVMGGHSRVLKTIMRIQLMFHWVHLKEDVRKYVSEYNICQTHKYSTLILHVCCNLFRYLL